MAGTETDTTGRGEPLVKAWVGHSYRGVRNLKKGSDHLLKKAEVKYWFIWEHAGKFSVEKMCRLFNISRSGYYQWLHHGPSARCKRNEVLNKKICEIYHEGRRLYGSPRIHRRLRKKGYYCGKKRVEQLMKEMGIWQSNRELCCS